jgi:peptidyl-prolyl isomerase D
MQVVDASDPWPLFPDDAVLEDRTVAGMIGAAEQIRALGNEHFKAQGWAKAVVTYSKALRYLKEDFPSPEETVSLAAATAKIQANRAACYIKLLQFGLAEVDCRAVLVTEPTNAKVHFRLGQVLMTNKDYEGAEASFLEAKALMPEDRSVAISPIPFFLSSPVLYS